MMRTKAFIVAAVVAAVVPAGGARAQQGAAGEADELVARAQALQGDVAAYTVAATLYERSAALRSAGDARGVDALVTAGRLFNYAGERPRALAAMVAGADRALKDGDVVTAANAYADAAYIAASQYDARAAALARKVVELADAWVPEERSAILHRLGPKVVAALQSSPDAAVILAMR